MVKCSMRMMVLMLVGVVMALGCLPHQVKAAVTAGIDWQKVQMPITIGSSQIINIIATPTMVIAAATGGKILTSTDDGVTWSVHDTGIFADLNSIAYDGNRFVVVGDFVNSSPVILTSTDGVNWTSVFSGVVSALPANLARLTKVVWAGGQFVAVGGQTYGAFGGSSTAWHAPTPWIITSPDGITWTDRSSQVPNLGYLSQIVWNGSRYLIPGGSLSAVSADGVNWTEVTQTISQVASHGHAFFATDGVTTKLSTDGYTWAMVSNTNQIGSLGFWDGTNFIGFTNPYSTVDFVKFTRWSIQLPQLLSYPINLPFTPALYTMTKVGGTYLTAIGHQIYRSFTDATPPVITPPANFTIAASSPNSTIAITDPYIQAFLTGAAAVDNIDGVITTISTFGPTSSYPVGTSTVVFAATDASGNSGTASATVTVADITPPAIAISGANPITVTIGANYNDGGATATDNFDGDVTASITTASTVNTAVPGSYSVIYAVSDLAGNLATASRQVIVADRTAPVVTAPANITVQASSAAGVSRSIVAIHTFLAGASAQDGIDGTIALVNNDAAATLPLGVSTITFSASDAAGNTGTATATISVVDLTKPVLSLQGLSPMTVEAGANYNDAGATAVDNVDGNISAAIHVNNGVDTATPGSYSVSYSISDAASNSASLTRKVTVVDSTPPAIVLPAAVMVNAVDTTGIAASDAAIQAFLGGALATDIVDGVIVVSPYNIPVKFSLGIHHVSFRSVDATGNIALATATLTVVDPTAAKQPVAMVMDSYGSAGSIVNVPIILQASDWMQITTFTIKINFDGYALTPGQPATSGLTGWTVSKTGPVAVPVGGSSQVIISGQAPSGQVLGSSVTITVPFTLAAGLVDGYSYSIALDPASSGYTTSGTLVGMQTVDGKLRVGTLALRALTLRSGWNLIGISAIPADGALAELIQQSGADSVWSYRNNRWQSYLTMLPKAMSSLQSLQQGRGYWVHLPGRGASITVMVKAFSGVGAAAVNGSGWQLIAVGNPVVDVGTFMTGYGASSVWSYRAGGWTSFISGSPSFLNSLQSMQPGEGYYVRLP